MAQASQKTQGSNQLAKSHLIPAQSFPSLGVHIHRAYCVTCYYNKSKHMEISIHLNFISNTKEEILQKRSLLTFTNKYLYCATLAD